MARIVSIILLVFFTITLINVAPSTGADDDENKKLENRPLKVETKLPDVPTDQKLAPPPPAKPSLKIADSPACAYDVRSLCAESTFANNFAVLSCLQDGRKVIIVTA